MGLAKSKMKPRVAQRLSLSAPVGGLNAIDPLQNMPATDAVVLNNFYPTESALEIRNGFKLYYDIFTEDIKTLFAYQGIANELFCASDGKIYKINKTNPPTKTEVANSFSNDEWQFINFGTPDNRFLVAVNGNDKMQLYNGTSWADANITGLKVGEAEDGESFRDIACHKSRIWVIRDDFTAGYLPVQSVQGEMSDFELGSLFSKGGKLVKLFTFSFSNVNNGSDDYLGFLSSEGEIVIYQGTDPTSSSTWSSVGVYKLAKPIGKRCTASFNGDVLIFTNQGVFSVQTLVSDSANVFYKTPARKINPLIVKFIKSYGMNTGSSIFFIPEKNKLYVNLIDSNDVSTQLVMNGTTGAWCRYSGMPCMAVASQNDIMYAGYKTKLYLFDYGTNDNGASIKAEAICAFSNYGSSEKKYVTSLRPFIFLNNIINPKIYIKTAVDFEIPFIDNDITASEWQNISYWGIGVWDSAYWSGSNQIMNNWHVSGAFGVYIAPALAVYGNFNSFTWSAVDIQYQVADGV